jgi:hypothetical protein
MVIANFKLQNERIGVVGQFEILTAPVPTILSSQCQQLREECPRKEKPDNVAVRKCATELLQPVQRQTAAQCKVLSVLFGSLSYHRL